MWLSCNPAYYFSVIFFTIRSTRSSYVMQKLVIERRPTMPHKKGKTMKHAKLLSVLLASALAAGCSGMMGNKAEGDAAGQRSAGQVVDDATITTKVKSALLADPEISGLKIDVDTMQGKVRLKGEVKTLALRKKAESIARGVAGVQSVNNMLIVTG